MEVALPWPRVGDAGAMRTGRDLRSTAQFLYHGDRFGRAAPARRQSGTMQARGKLLFMHRRYSCIGGTGRVGSVIGTLARLRGSRVILAHPDHA